MALFFSFVSYIISNLSSIYLRISRPAFPFLLDKRQNIEARNEVNRIRVAGKA